MDSAQYKISLRKRMRWLNNEIKKIMVGILFVFELIDVSILNDIEYFHSSINDVLKHICSGNKTFYIRIYKLLKLIINFEQPDV